jgi:hypothetical protein
MKGLAYERLASYRRASAMLWPTSTGPATATRSGVYALVRGIEQDFYWG